MGEKVDSVTLHTKNFNIRDVIYMSKHILNVFVWNFRTLLTWLLRARRTRHQTKLCQRDPLVLKPPHRLPQLSLLTAFICLRPRPNPSWVACLRFLRLNQTNHHRQISTSLARSNRHFSTRVTSTILLWLAVTGATRVVSLRRRQTTSTALSFNAKPTWRLVNPTQFYFNFSLNSFARPPLKSVKSSCSSWPLSYNSQFNSLRQKQKPHSISHHSISPHSASPDTRSPISRGRRKWAHNDLFS